jgi:hypothetical protein
MELSSGDDVGQENKLQAAKFISQPSMHKMPRNLMQRDVWREKTIPRS